MPLVTISLIKGKTPDHVRAIREGVHQALVENFAVPQDDLFQLVRQVEPDELIYSRHYLGIHRTDDIVLINILASDWRNLEQKQELYRAIVDNLARDPGLRPEDVQVILTPNKREDWSFGLGNASYVEKPAN